MVSFEFSGISRPVVVILCKTNLFLCKKFKNQPTEALKLHGIFFLSHFPCINFTALTLITKTPIQADNSLFISGNTALLVDKSTRNRLDFRGQSVICSRLVHHPLNLLLAIPYPRTKYKTFKKKF